MSNKYRVIAAEPFSETEEQLFIGTSKQANSFCKRFKMMMDEKARFIEIRKVDKKMEKAKKQRLYIFKLGEKLTIPQLAEFLYCSESIITKSINTLTSNEKDLVDFSKNEQGELEVSPVFIEIKEATLPPIPFDVEIATNYYIQELEYKLIETIENPQVYGIIESTKAQDRLDRLVRARFLRQ